MNASLLHAGSNIALQIASILLLLLMKKFMLGLWHEHIRCTRTSSCLMPWNWTWLGMNYLMREQVKKIKLLITGPDYSHVTKKCMSLVNYNAFSRTNIHGRHHSYIPHVGLHHTTQKFIMLEVHWVLPWRPNQATRSFVQGEHKRYSGAGLLISH